MRGRLVFVCRSYLLFAVAGGGLALSTGSVLADSFDWRSIGGKNWNTPVKSQFGGTCWDFAAIGAFESKYKLTRNDPSFNPDLSEQQLCWETAPDLGGTGGGGGVEAMAYSASHGVVSESVCPHDPNHEDVPASYPTDQWPLESVFPSPDSWENHIWKSSANSTPFVTSTTDGIKAAVKSQGPLLTGILSTNDLYGTVADLKANYRGPMGGVDHAVVIVGYQDDAEVPSGGYWIIKNSWGGTDITGYYYIPYGDVENHLSTQAYADSVYYTGALATVTWTGTTNSTWDTTYANRRNWSKSGANYQWVNQETQANFTATPTRKTITISGTAIAHGLNFSAAGYTVSSGSLTVTAGGITTTESVTINSPLYVGAPQAWNVATGKTLSITGALHTIISDVTIAGDGDTTISGPIDGGGVLNTYGAKPGGLIQAGAGTLTLSGSSNFAGDIRVNAGTLNLSPAGAGSATYGGDFFGSATIVVNTAGTVSLAGDASGFTGGLTVNAGTLNCIGAGLPSGNCTINDATLNIGGSLSHSVGTLQLNGGVLSGAGTLTSTAGYFVQSGTINPTLAGSAGLTKSTTGSVIIDNASYTGPTNLQDGTLTFSSSLPGGSYIISNGNLVINGLSRTIGNLTITGGTISGTGTLTSSSCSIQAGRVDVNVGGATLALTKSGAGTAILNGANTYGGLTTINGGMLSVSNLAANGSSSNLGIGEGMVFNGGTLQYTGGANSVFNRRMLLVSGGGTVSQSGSGYLFCSGVIFGGGSFTKTGSAPLIVQADNTYTGQTNVNVGQLQIRHVNALGTTAGKTVVASGAVLSVGGGLTGTINEPVNLNGNGDGGGALQVVDAGTDVTFTGAVNLVSSAGIGGTSHFGISGSIGGTGGLTKVGTNRVNLTGANTYSGITTVASGTLELDSAAQNCVFTLGGADIQGGKMVFVYAGTSTLGETVNALLAGSYDGGLWDVGQLKSTTAASLGMTLGCLDDGLGKVTVMSTYAGDFNLDGVVNLNDLDVWKSNLGLGTTWQTGDANYDGAVNLGDLDFWKANLGSVVGGGSAAAALPVPEPGTLVILAAIFVSVIAYVRKQR